MLDPVNVPDVTESEVVTRYLLFSKWFRADQTIKHEAFMPPADLEFSVTRLLQAAEPELWEVGFQVGLASNRTLHGRADLAVPVFVNQQLLVRSDALPNNPNHAKVIGWPEDKAHQMMVAKQLAATIGLRRIPPPSTASLSDLPVSVV